MDIRAGIHKMLVRIANREDPDQTASSEAVWSGSALFVHAFLAGNKFLFVLMLNIPVNKFSVKSGQFPIFLG